MDFLKWLKVISSVGCAAVGGLMSIGIIDNHTGTVILAILGALGVGSAANDHNTSAS